MNNYLLSIGCSFTARCGISVGMMMRFFSLDELTQYTALQWLREFLNMPSYHKVLLPHSAGLLSAVLPCYSYDDDNRQNILFFGLFAFVFL